MTDIHRRLEKVRERIAEAEIQAGRAPGGVRLLAVSKKQSAGRVREAARAGQRLFGESYLQEAAHKIRSLDELGLEWHFIGPIQSNKTRHIAELFGWVHSVDRFRIAGRLSEQRPARLPPLNICLQLNIDRESTKSGIDPEDLPALAREVMELPRLRLRGLMAIPAPRRDRAAQRRAFAAVRASLEKLRDSGLALDTLSMGMSGDLEAAVAEGATIVRVGTAIFGPRS